MWLGAGLLLVAFNVPLLRLGIVQQFTGMGYLSAIA